MTLVDAVALAAASYAILLFVAHWWSKRTQDDREKKRGY